MKEIASIIAQPGMILAKDVVYKDKVIFPADTVLDTLVIDRLQRYSIMCVSIKDNEDLASTHYEKMRFNQRFLDFEAAFNKSLLEFKAYMLMFVETGKKPRDEVFLQIYEKLAAMVPNGAVLLDYLYMMVPNEDELTFTHCLNSALLAGCFADWLSFTQEKKNILIMCGFFTDIGKYKMPYDILWKPDKLTQEEFELVRSHPTVGFRMVQYVHLNDHIKNAVLMHHERMDGSGYPSGLSGDEIDYYARIISIVDTYIAMSSPRSYRSAMTPMQIIEHFERSMGKYDVELLIPLLKRIADAQIGTIVQLNDDSVWEIMIIHPTKFSRPILRNKNSEILDLSQNPNLKIEKNL